MLTATPALASSSNNQKTEHSYFSKLAAKSRATNTTYKAGQYIVRLKAQPASTYTGGLRGFGATKPSAGKQLNANTDAVKSYSAHLKSTQVALAGKFGFKALYNYTLAYNGFAAKLTAAQANALAKNSAVSTLTPSKLLKVQVAPSVTPPSDLSSIKYLNIDTGVWDKNGGPANAGKGVVLGDIDTGIAPENPSFAGDPLETASTASTTPAIIDGGGVDNVQFKKADGGTFSSTIIPDAPGWTSSDLSTKIIGAHFFVNGFGVGNLGSTAARGEYVSPRDGAGHGSHTASTAAGDYGVDATVAGTDFGGISGVAPAAKISVYKVCWDGPALDESQDGCAESDMVAAIDQAVRDGVDVLNFSIGGGAAVTTFSPTDEAFYNAASAGIFVAAAGGNAGPDSSTLDNASPWETTVAASTIPSYEATATLGNLAKYAGASNTVGFGTLPQVPDGSALVDAKTHTAGGSTSTISALCGPNSLDDATVTGKVVLCDRGTYDRVAKSAEVLRAGGIGMILVNVPGGANDVDLDQHSVPTIHVSNAFNAALHAYAATATPTVSFSAGNTSPIQTPVPQIAGFSSRGPVQADGSDILKPDVAAPGVAILAAVNNGPVGGLNPAPKWDFFSGTSMATPHVAGLALLYLAIHPVASVSEIQSALKTTATNTVDADGVSVTDPFSQGSGEVNPSRYLSPALLYLSKQSDWNNYLYSVGEVTHSDPGFESAVKIDPSNLNRASIAIGDFFGSQTVTRTVTAQSIGTYQATVSVPGLHAVVSPSTLKFTKVGQTASFKVIFTKGNSQLDSWATGFLTWKKYGSPSVTVRSDIAVHPTAVKAPLNESATGVSGSIKVPITAGFTGDAFLIPLGLAKGDISNPTGPLGNQYSGTAVQGDHAVYTHDVIGSGPDFERPGTEYMRFNVKPIADAPTTDLDLYVAYYAPGEDIPTDPSLADITPNIVAASATGASDETVDYFPDEQQYEDGGTYLSFVDYFAAPVGGTQYAETWYNLRDNSADGGFNVNPDPVSVKAGVPTSYTASWAGLDTNAQFVGFVIYAVGEGDATFFDINTLHPVVKTKPTVTGTPKVGSTLTGHDAVWDSSGLTVTSQWLSDGEPLGGETTHTHVLTNEDLGHKLSFQQTAASGAGLSTTTESLPTAIVKATSTTAFTFVDATITTSQHAVLNIVVTSDGTATPSGTVTVKYGTKSSAVVTLDDSGEGTLTLPRLGAATYTISATYNGDGVTGTSTVSHKLKVS